MVECSRPCGGGELLGKRGPGYNVALAAGFDHADGQGEGGRTLCGAGPVGVARAQAEVEGLALGPEHRAVIRFLREAGDAGDRAGRDSGAEAFIQSDTGAAL